MIKRGAKSIHAFFILSSQAYVLLQIQKPSADSIFCNIIK
jgi:hypothetical protein